MIGLPMQRTERGSKMENGIQEIDHEVNGAKRTKVKQTTAERGQPTDVPLWGSSADALPEEVHLTSSPLQMLHVTNTRHVADPSKQ
jgi:hypothetical protein